MDSQQTAAETQPVFIREDHPWLDVPDGNLDERDLQEFKDTYGVEELKKEY